MEVFRRRVSGEYWEDDGLFGVWDEFGFCEAKSVLSFLVLLLVLLNSALSCAAGVPLPRVYVSPLISDWPWSMNKFLLEHVRSVSARMFTSTRSHHHRGAMPFYYQPTITHDPSLTDTATVTTPRRHHLPRNKHHHCYHAAPHAMVPSLLTRKGCNLNCSEPLIHTPFGLPCVCVLPMEVRLLLGTALYALFPVMGELETEVAAGTYLKKNQVKIMSAITDKQNQEKTVVDINLVPIGKKFDITTAVLIYKRLWCKKVPLNMSLFGSYQVVNISYPGIPSSQSHGTYMGSDPPVVGDLPTSTGVKKVQKMDFKTIVIICLSIIEVLLVIIGAAILQKLKRSGRPSNAVGPAILSSIDEKAGSGSVNSGSVGSATSSSPVSTMSSRIHSIKTFALADLEKATEKFSSRRILCESGSGHVYRATLEDGNEVAVKLLANDMDNLKEEHEFIAEVEMLSRFNHRNIVKLIGICINGDAKCLVYENVPNGSVESHLHGADKKEASLGWDVRMKIALGAARGLAYLHEDSNPRMVHCDFKACNVLLDDDFTPKVSDFELARDATQKRHEISTQVMRTSGYVDPEYARTGYLFVKADVFSYGVMLLELLSGRKPVDVSQPPGQENLVTWARPLLSSKEGLKQVVDTSLAGSFNFNDLAKVAAVASLCIHPVVNKRPFMGEVVQALKLIYNKTDEIFDNGCSERESSGQFSDVIGDLASSDSSWWNAGGANAYPFLTTEYSSCKLGEMETRPFSTSLIPDKVSLPISESGPYRIFRSRRSMSEGAPFSRRFLSANYWV